MHQLRRLGGWLLATGSLLITITLFLAYESFGLVIVPEALVAAAVILGSLSAATGAILLSIRLKQGLRDPSADDLLALPDRVEGYLSDLLALLWGFGFVLGITTMLLMVAYTEVFKFHPGGRFYLIGILALLGSIFLSWGVQVHRVMREHKRYREFGLGL